MVNRVVRNGLEIPVCNAFQGHVKGVEWTKKTIDEAKKKFQARFEKCMKNSVQNCFLLLLYYYSYKQNISYWILCFYLPFGQLKLSIKTEKNEKVRFMQVIF